MNKQNLIIALLVLTVVFSCKKKDDDGGGQACQTCTFATIGEDYTPEYCDNGDGTATFTFEGESETISLAGATFSQFIATLEQTGGAVCN
ncbi:MAG: hypothetical protein R2776_03185 [Flavobacteriaceae bacterium]|nr:hypothetical protein [Flavobacteriaceae bacterium]